MGTVFIVGNGFDLDLGLRTSYKNFFDSKYFPKDEGSVVRLNCYFDPDISTDTSLGRVSVFDYLRVCRDLSHWCDIEGALGKLPKYVDFENGDGFYIEKDSFDRLHQAFSDYLRSVLKDDYDTINYKSAAYKVAKTLSYRTDLVVFNYNYTDSLEHIDRSYDGIVNYVHGSLIDNSIIFGVEDKLDVQRHYNFLLKSFSPFYKSHKIRYELKNADHVIFFGHSLAKADYHYFEHLFQDLTDETNDSPDRRITIFTKDDKSRRDLLWQIRTMNHNKTDVLFGNCELKIFMTDTDEEKIIPFLDGLLPGATDNSFLFE